MVLLSSDWFKKQDKDRFNTIKSIVEDLKARRKPQFEKDKSYVRMYSNRNILGMESFNYYKIDPRREADEDNLKLNVISSVIDTLLSKLAVEQPRVVSLTSAADFSVRSKSKDLQKFIDGILESSGSHTEALSAFRDALIMGTGVLRVLDEWGNIKCERVPKHEIHIDEEEAFYGDITQLHQVRVMSRIKLIEMFPAKKKQIKQASRAESETLNTSDLSDLIEIRESWHLPSGPEATDGIHCITIDTCDLIDEEYKHDSLPFVFMNWKAPVHGFWGSGIVEEIRPLQIEINNLLISAQKAMRVASNPMVFIQKGSSISKAHLSNEIGVVIPYVGQPPIIRAHQTVNPEIFNQVESLYKKAFEIVGVSMMSAAGKKSPGINAAVAMREMQNIESERFSLALRDYSEVFVSLAKQMIIRAKDLYVNEEADTKVFIKAKGFLEEIDWSVIDLEEDQFSLSVDTANKLPLTRAGRISTITEWYQAGLIGGDQWRELMNMPDVNEENELNNAPKEYIRSVVYDILFKGELMPPEAHDDLRFAYKYSIMQYQRAKLNKYPDDKIDLLGQYISMIEFMMKEAKDKANLEANFDKPPMPPQPQLPPGPPGPPGPPQGKVPMPLEAAQLLKK